MDARGIQFLAKQSLPQGTPRSRRRGGATVRSPPFVRLAPSSRGSLCHLRREATWSRRPPDAQYLRSRDRRVRRDAEHRCRNSDRGSSLLNAGRHPDGARTCMSTVRETEGQASRAATQHPASVCERAYRDGAMKTWRRRTSSGVHQGCTRLARHAVHSHPADTDLSPFAGACTTEDYLAQRRFLPYKQEVGGSSPSPPTRKVLQIRLLADSELTLVRTMFPSARPRHHCREPRAPRRQQGGCVLTERAPWFGARPA